MHAIRRRAPISAALALILVLASVADVLAVGVSQPVVTKASFCHRGIAWKGMPQVDWGPNAPPQSRGSVDHCVWLYKFNDGDSTADYYILAPNVEWNVTSDLTSSIYAPSNQNYAKAVISSSMTAMGSVYDATPNTITATSGCHGFGASVGFFGASVSVTENLCNSVTLRRDYKNATGAQWSTDNMVRTPYWDLAYMIKVPQGAKPTFTARLYYPNYTVYNTGTIRCQYYCYPVWGTTKTLSTNTFTVITP